MPVFKALLAAVNSKDTKKLKTLIRNANLKEVNFMFPSKDVIRESPVYINFGSLTTLLHASEQAEITQILLDHGADPNLMVSIL